MVQKSKGLRPQGQSEYDELQTLKWKDINTNDELLTHKSKGVREYDNWHKNRNVYARMTSYFFKSRKSLAKVQSSRRKFAWSMQKILAISTIKVKAKITGNLHKNQKSN